MPLIGMTLEQRRQAIDTEQIWEAWTAARQRARGYLGSMSWRRTNGRDYLIRQFTENGVRRGRSLGPRSAVTERMLEEFQRGKRAAHEAVDQMGRKLETAARVNRALRLARVPLPAAKVIRALERSGLLGSNLLVVGTHAIFAYEAAAGVFVDQEILATGDLDVLFDARARLRLRAADDVPSLLDVLRDADASFEIAPHAPFRAVNSEGFYVDVIKAVPQDVIASSEPDALGGDADLQAAHVPNMRWIANAPRFAATAIGADGYPVPMACPDPRAFALYKLWMGTRDPARDPRKRARDVVQARIVAEIVNEHMPALPFAPEHLACFPRRATELGQAAELFQAGIRL